MSQKLLFLVFAIYCSSEMSWKQLITFGTVAVSGFLYLIYIQQEKILYLNETIPPKKTSQNPSPFANPRQQGLDFEDVWITTNDGIKLHCWWIPCDLMALGPDGKAPTVVFYHANAGNMGFRLPNLVSLHSKLNVNIFILSYRGYGESEGSPNEDGIKIDAVAGLDYVLSRSNEVDPERVFLFGRSLGGAVAIYAAAETERRGGRLGGVIVENTFTSIADMVGKVFPFLDFDFIKQFMLKIHWRSIDLVPSIRAKMLFFASDHDEIVPHYQMLRLHKEAKSARSKDLYVIEGAMHNDAWMKGGEVYWQKMYRFVHGE